MERVRKPRLSTTASAASAFAIVERGIAEIVAGIARNRVRADARRRAKLVGAA